ncbi:5-oxoprolinase subunit PxpA [Bacillaceae bacterium W0354]
MAKRVDLNCDMGEGFGTDEQIMPFITSANIACGGHFGNEKTMEQAVILAKKNQVAIGAHPSFPDQEGFGRKMINLSLDQIYMTVVEQIKALQNVCNRNHVEMQHVKPHGALYNLAARNKQVAEVIVNAVYDCHPDLILFGLSGSELIKVAKTKGLKVASEVFADRTYQVDGTLTPRTESSALIDDVDDAIKQVEQMVKEGKVKAVTGEWVDISADTICIHGDNDQAVDFSKKVNEALKNSRIDLIAVGE